ncbi:MAG: acetamidase/formamidase family protein [Anaerolineaceae bacterium]|nr:acetamidase/formamidase family protein [Anaerolineaceae bacterium]
MTQKVSRSHVFFSFHPDLEPVLRIQQGEEVVMETHDCFEGQIRNSNDLIDVLDWEHVNPATGPVYIEGAKPGDVLRVDLLKMEIGDQSIMVTVPGEGALGDLIVNMETVLLKLEGNEVVFKDKIRVPKKPMIGVIGVAPATGSVPNGTPGAHGGNMDCTLVTEGASLYFTVGVDGALFGAGDFHAAMGDGEIVICGAETPGEFRFRAQVVESLKGLPTPFLRNEDVVAVIVSATTIDEATSGATHAMARFLTEFVGLSVNDAGMLMSLVGELKFCQVVDPEKTVRFEFPNYVLDQYGYKMN